MLQRLIRVALLTGSVFSIGTHFGQSTFSNTSNLCPSDGNTSGVSSTISVTGQPTSISTISVTIPNISHSWYDDLDIMLISPTGQRLVLMSDCGGNNSGNGNRNYTFIQGGTVLNDGAPPTASGNVSPTGFETPDTWPDGAPTISSMNQLTGNPNGTWTLRVIDDAVGDAGCLNGGWSITFTSSQFKTNWVSMNSGSSVWCAGETRNVSVTVTNAGTQSWADGPADYNIGVKWNAESDYFVRVDAQNLAPGATQTFNLTVTAPTTAGSNNLSFDVVREGCFWFANNSTACGVTAGPNNVVFVSSPITINPSPTPVSITPSAISICANDNPVLLTASGGIGGVPGQSATISGNSGTINLAIPDNSAVGVSNAISISGIPANASITQVDVTFSLNHAWLNDAEVVLRAANGRRIALTADQGPSGSGSYNNVVISSNTSAAVLSTSGTPITGTFRANATAAANLIGGNFSNSLTSTFSDLFGTTNGNWVIEAYDDVAADLGNLVSWSISITYSLPSFVWTPSSGLDPDGTGPQPPYTGGNATSLFALPSATQTYTVTTTNSVGCSASANAVVTILPLLNASVSLAANNSTLCSGMSATFTATPTNGGTAPTYEWRKNGTAIAGASGATYSGIAGTDFVNGDVITCQLTSNATPCLAGSPATSNGVTMTVNALVPTNTPGTYVSSVVNHADGTMQEYTANCVVIGRTTDPSGGNVPGNTTMTCRVVPTMESTNAAGWKYVRRSYTSTTASDGQRTLTFYFTQEDFDDYNANNYGSMDLPTSGNNTDPNKPYIRLITVTSSGFTVSASLGNNLTWNGTYWQLTRLVQNVIGATYYVTTQSSCEGVLVNGLAAGNISATNATLTWTAISPNPSTGYYQFRYKATASSTWIDGGTAGYLATSKLYNTLSPGTQYEFQIRRVCSSDGFGAWCSSVIFSTVSAGCGSPMVFSAPSSTSSSVALSWPAVTGAAWFEFQYKASNSSNWVSAGTLTGTGTTRTISGLNPNTTYDFRGRSYCPNNAASAWSTVVNATTTGQSGCDLPPVLTVSSTTNTTVTVTWPVISGAAWYEFRYKENSSGTWTSGGTSSGTSTSKTISGLTADANYIIQARTFCSNGTPSNWSSSSVFGTTEAAGCDTPPVLTVASVSNTTATITWPVITGAAWYEFRYKASASSTWISCGTLSGTGTTRVLSGLTANTQYDFQAKTFCPNGSTSSTWSSTLQFTTTGAATIALAEGDVIESSEGQSTKEMAINEASGVAVNVFPNPTDDLVQVQVIIEQANETLVVRVFDMSGRLVQEAQTLTEGGLTTIPLSMGEMMTGMYNLELYQNGALIHRTRVQKN